MVLCLITCTLLKSVEFLYVHGFAACKTLAIMRNLNKEEQSETEDKKANEALWEMFIYWIVLCITSLIDSWFFFIPFLHELRVLFLAATLTPKINLKRRIYELAFTG